MRPFGSPEQLQRRRERAIELLHQGNHPAEVARKLGVDRRSVRRWKAAYNKKGMQGIRAKRASGRPPRLTAKQRDKLKRVLLKGAAASGFSTDLWTCPRIAKVIQARFGVRYHVDYMGRLLRSMRWTPQKPQRRAKERDKVEIQRWVREEWPRIKKKPAV
jgi:transposase